MAFTRRVLVARAAFSGIRTVSRDGAVLYVVQANFGLMQNRVLLFDPLSGAQRDQIKLDVNALGYDGSPTAMALGLNDLLYLFVHDNTNGQAKLISVDPSSKQVRPLMTLGADDARHACGLELALELSERGQVILRTSHEVRVKWFLHQYPAHRDRILDIGEGYGRS